MSMSDLLTLVSFDVLQVHIEIGCFLTNELWEKLQFSHWTELRLAAAGWPDGRDEGGKSWRKRSRVLHWPGCSIALTVAPIFFYGLNTYA